MIVIRKLLEFFATLLILCCRFVGYVYTQGWSFFHVSWYDHRFDFLRGPSNWYWTERGVLGNYHIPFDGEVLDLCCGDGTFSGLFYSTRAKHVDALDIDPEAIQTAKSVYAKPNVSYQVQDVLRGSYPKKFYDTILLFVAIEHFSVEHGRDLLKKIGAHLQNDQSTFIGSTVLFEKRGGHNFEHDNEFLSEKQVKDFLTPYFKEVRLWISSWPKGRQECYFVCRGAKK
ncbi:MAG: class I SAM-dependent methyltransferase [Candidatus Pacebacteria bacterium]|nr:class I SAM-dependent methyltransferase [Candidatus Paceibacterota bacterium]